MRDQLISFLDRVNEAENFQLFDVDVCLYVDKLQKYASIISIIKDSKLKGLVAYYANDQEKGLAFLSMLAVDPKSTSMGYGKMLLTASIKEIEKKGFKKYGLEVRKNNLKAIELYNSFGFINIEDRKENFIYMEKTL